jgi:heme oxygenase
MNNLRELTKEEHRRAERTAFMNRLLKKQITPYQYYVYIKNQMHMYVNLEYYATEMGIFGSHLNVICRGPSLLDDVISMESQHGFKDAPILSSAYDYVKYIEEIKSDRDKILAHMYVRHMGDLSGGQMIKKLVPGPTSLYEFEGDVDELKGAIRNSLHDGLEEEAKVCFNMVQKFLEELEENFGSMGPANTAIE